MNKFPPLITSLVGAKPLTFIVAFSGLVALLVLPSRRGGSDWSGSLDDVNRSLSGQNLASVNLESPDAVPVNATRVDRGSNASVSEPGAPFREADQPVVLAASPTSTERPVEFARATATSAADEFGLTSRSEQAAPQFLGSGSAAHGGTLAPLSSGGRSGGGAGAATSGNAGTISGGSAGERAEAATPSPASESVRTSPHAAPLSDTVADPSPVVPDPIPLANSPAPSPSSSASGQSDNPVSAPTHSGEADPQPLANNAFPTLGNPGIDATDGIASLPVNPGAMNPLAVPGLNDLPSEADVKPDELAPVSHVPDSGRSWMLLAGALLGLWSFRRWQAGSMSRS